MRFICDLITLRHTIFLFLISSKIVRRLENPYLRLVRPHKDKFEVNLVEVTFWIDMHPWNALCNSCNTFLQGEKQFSSMMKSSFLKRNISIFCFKSMMLLYNDRTSSYTMSAIPQMVTITNDLWLQNSQKETFLKSGHVLVYFNISLLLYPRPIA